jgi:hypothetical protein
MRTLFLLAALALYQIAYAGSSSVVIAVGYSPYTPTVRMQVAADYVAIPINIQNDSKDPVKRSDEIEKALRLVTERLKQHPDLTMRPGVVSLSPTEQSGLKSYSGYDSYGGSSAQLYVLGALKSDANVFSLTKRIYQTVSAIQQSDGTKITFGKTALGLNDPEKYRNQLLGLVAKAITETKKSLGIAGAVEVGGLENPVAVMQINESEVVLFINYTLRIETKAT